MISKEVRIHTICGSERETNCEGEVAGEPVIVAFVLVRTMPRPEKLLFCLGRRCCRRCFSCVASQQGHVLCCAVVPWVPDLASYLYFFWIFCVVLLLVVALPYCALIRQCFSLAFLRAKNEPVGGGGGDGGEGLKSTVITPKFV